MDSDTESITTPDVESGAVTPSTAASSVAGGRKTKLSDPTTRALEAEDDDEDEDEEPVRAAGTRGTPKRSAAAAASKKLAAPAHDVSSDLSEANQTSDEEEKVVRKLQKGKGKAIVLSSGSEADNDDEDAEMDQLEDSEGETEDVKRVRALAKALKASRGTGSEPTSSAARGKAISKSVASKFVKGKGKANPPSFSVVVPSRGSSASKASSAKSKSKKVIVLSDSDGSDFELPSGTESSHAADDSDASMAEMAEFLSDVDTDEDQLDRMEKLKKLQKKTKKPHDPNALPARKGIEISPKQRAEMKKLSQFDKNAITLNLNHPELTNCWTDLAAIPITVPTRAIQPAGLTQKLLPFQLEGLNWMVEQEKGPWGGGMLADEMGMGKTIQTISLLLSDHSRTGPRKCTLVLAPTVAIMQWRNEIDKFTEGFKVLIFHGANRADNIKELEKFDVVLTSYAVMESGYRREQKGFQKKGKMMKEDSILHKIKWHRVILDEAHNIKDRASNTAKAAFALKSKFRWCLSGTPLQNRVGELYSLIRFLGADPFAYYFCKKCDCKSLHWLCNKGPCSECRHSGMQHVCYWNNDILKPIQYGSMQSEGGAIAFKKLTTLLERMMLRRTKVERADDLGLPPRVVNVRRDYFTEEEEEMYKSLYQDVKRKFTTYAAEGTVLNNYSNIFTLITRMRQMADHPTLITHSKTAMSIQHAPEDKPEELLTCRICFDEAEDAVQTQCRHIFCRECVRQYLETALEQKPGCPVCNVHMTIDLDQEAIERDTTGRQGILGRLDPSKDRTSTKIEALVEELSKLRTEDHTLKSLVFSQFTTMLDLVARRLQLGGFKIVRLQGTMTPTARDNTIQHFTNNPDVTVFLISLKAGGVALNLTEASRVFILDPWWNPAVELQAMDRIHRLGQHRPVVVTRLIIENSIESRILELQKKKENLAASALGDDDKAMGRLTPEDLRFLFSL
ncbi:hypothetical protein RQP46_003093 [Phenoliferia psychrophenolica]